MLTYKRPDWLSKALLSVLSQEVDADCQFSVVVIDNDPDASAASTVAEISNRFPPRVRYFHEPQKGIARARNRALSEAQEFDFVCSIDDDEFALPGWLRQLVQIQTETGADVVCGPVIPEFENAPEWVRKGGFFAPKTHLNRAAIRWVATNNLIMKGEIARNYRFDTRFDKTSGEDTHFFERVRMDGKRFVWAADAKVVEIVPAGRTTARWIIDRARSTANRVTRTMLYLRPGLRTRIIRAGKAMGGLIVGAVTLPRGLFGFHYAVKSRALMARGLGTFSALFNREHKYYD